MRWNRRSERHYQTDNGCDAALRLKSKAWDMKRLTDTAANILNAQKLKMKEGQNIEEHHRRCVC